jgi:glycosyltransferase involved in cell wall biosynthesis
MKLGTSAIAYNEQRFIGPHLDHIPLADKLVLVSTRSYQGQPAQADATEQIARDKANCIVDYWKNEHDQRNVAQEYYSDYDWVLHLDPDEFLLPEDWLKLIKGLEQAEGDAYSCALQYTYWRSGYRIDPPEPYCQIIAVRPTVRFVDRRDINIPRPWASLPVNVHHFSWARTDDEVWQKITNYSHAHEIKANWYEKFWLGWSPELRNLHPTSPKAYKSTVSCTVPPQFEALLP